LARRRADGVDGGCAKITRGGGGVLRVVAANSAAARSQRGGAFYVALHHRRAAPPPSSYFFSSATACLRYHPLACRRWRTAAWRQGGCFRTCGARLAARAWRNGG